MQPRAWVLLSFGALAAGVACDGGDSSPGKSGGQSGDAAAVGGAGGSPANQDRDGGSIVAGGAGGAADAAGVGSDGPVGGRGSQDAGAGSDVPPLAVNPAAKRLVRGPVQLLGNHETSCSHQEPASADGHRWCAFAVPGTAGGNVELWVVDATAAAAGNVACDGTNPACRRLTTTLWTGQPANGPAFPTATHFEGDTLIIYADTPRNVPIYSGPIYAWRPGWTEMRRISSGTAALTCEGHGRADVALCVENVTTVTPQTIEFELKAGRLGALPLANVARITPLSMPTGDNQWQAGFSPDGAWFAYSTGGRTATDRETLFVSRTEDAGAADKRVMVASNVSRWEISPDAKRWYYLKAYNYDVQGSPAGTLAASDFPMGGNEAMLAPAVGGFQVLSDATGVDRGLAYIQNVAVGKGTLKVLGNVTMPAAASTFPFPVIGWVFSPDLRFALVSKQFANSGLVDSFVTKLDGTAACELAPATTSDLFGQPFTKGGQLVFWADKVNTMTGTGEGWVATSDGCGNKQKFGDGLDFWFVSSDRGLLFSDMTSGNATRLRFVKLGPGGSWPATEPVTIQDGVTRMYAPVGADLQHVLFTVLRGGAEDGLYVFGPIGF